MTPPEQADRASQCRPTPWSRRAVRWLADAALLFGALCLITLPGAHGLWVWAGVSLVAATVAEQVIEVGGVRFRPRRRWLLGMGRLPGAVLADTWLLARRLAGRTTGESRFEGVAFPDAGDDDAAVTRRVLAEIAGSVSPNVFALGVDREHHVLVVHQLVPRDGIADESDPLGLR